MIAFLKYPQRALAALAVAALPGLSLGETLALTGEDQARLGIVSQAVTAADSRSGIRVPALVISSPEAPSQLAIRHAGVLQTWHRPGGATVAAGELVATVHSPELAQIQEQWLAAVFEQANQQAQLDKDRQLFAEGIISRQRLAQTQRAAQQAAFNRNAWQGQLQQAGFNGAALEQLRIGHLPPGNYLLRAPQAGLLNREFVSVGDAVAANQTLASITTSTTLWLRATVSAPLAAGLTLGQELRLAEVPNSPLQLVSKNRELSPGTQRVEILARFRQPVALLPGQRVSLVLSSATPGVRVPASAITRNGSSAAVYVRRDEGFEVRELTLLPLGEDYLASTGLQAGEEIAVQGAAQLKGMLLGLGGGE
ncbi:efflux RND transporter periplasmic adaptor subunit [Spongiibacter tropicus]|uniref:efflux RND transporter periplasmic adaptor subunit n=1 Tax=Spongiibacter tropicus TaxID=454602 RepID=UPI0035BE323B